MEGVRTVRLFVSSPFDVDKERRRVEQVVQRLNGEFASSVRFETVRWETRFYSAHDTFQQQIPEAAACEIVVAIFGTRLGSELPPEFPRRLPDGSPYPSGTAYEVLTAIEARRKGDFPDVYVFRKTVRPVAGIDDPDELEAVRTQWERLKAFFEKWFQSAQGHFRAAFQSFASTDEFAEQVDALLRDWLQKHVLHGERAVVWPVALKGSPFRSLEPYDAGHAAVFFGRAHDIRRGVEELTAAAEQGTPFLLITGASGVGKSSFVRAGLAPRLVTPGVISAVDHWRQATFRPGGGATPFAALSDALFAAAGQDGQGVKALPELAEGDSRTPEEFALLLAGLPDSAVRAVLRALDRIGGREGAAAGYERDLRTDLVLIVDQLDDLFVDAVSAADRNRFGELLAALAQSGRVWVVATLRAELYEQYLGVPALVSLKAGGAEHVLSPPGAAEIAEIVRAPAEAARLRFGRGDTGETLDERLIREAGSGDTLPLLQFTLQRLFEQREEMADATYLTYAAYERMGGIDGAIDQTAEAALAKLGEQEHVGLPRLLRLLAVPVLGRQGPGVAHLDIRAAARSRIDGVPGMRRLVDALVDARILTTGEEGGVPQVRLSHQRVLESWKRARTQLATDRRDLEIHALVAQQLRRWQEARGGMQQRRLLLRNPDLANAIALQQRWGDELEPEMRQYIVASRRRARLRQNLAAAAAVAFALLAAWGFIEERRADRNYVAAKQTVDRMITEIAEGLRDVAGMRVATVQQILETVNRALNNLVVANPGDPELERKQARMFNSFADIYQRAGEFARAREAGDKSLEISRRLAHAAPRDDEAQVELAISLHVVADALRLDDNWTGARPFYEQERKLLEQLHLKDPAEPRRQRQLALCLTWLGEVMAEAGERDAARTAFTQALLIADRVAEPAPEAIKEKPGTPEFEREMHEYRRVLSLVLDAFGWFTLDDDDHVTARLMLERQVALDEESFRRNPGNHRRHHDVASSLSSLAESWLRAMRPDMALPLFERAKKIFLELTAIDPGNTYWQLTLSHGHLKLGESLRQMKDVARARESYEQALVIMRRLVTINPDNMQWQSTLVTGLVHLARVLDGRARRATLEEALAIIDHLEKAGRLGRSGIQLRDEINKALGETAAGPPDGK